MRHSSLDGRIGFFVWLILACAFSAAPATAAEIFKCVAKDGTALYQNFPCNIDSIGSVASNPSIAIPALSAALLAVFGEPALMAGAYRVGDAIGVLPVLFHLLWRHDLQADLSVPLHPWVTVTTAVV